MADDIDHYTEIARRLLNEFIELIITFDRSGALNVKDVEKERTKHERELRKWKEANETLKDSLKAMATDNERLEHEVLVMESERDDARRRLNEYLMGRRETAKKVESFPLDQHMTEEAYKKWQEIRQMMSEVPYRGEKDDGS